MLRKLSLALPLFFASHSYAISIDLVAAKGYNLFIKENFSQPGADSQGKIAVGGNANIGQYDVGVNYEPGTHRDGIQFWTSPNKYEDVLVVGGNLTTTPWAWGNVKGNAIIGGSLTAGSSTHAVLGTTTKANPIDFTAAFNELTGLSQSLAGLSNTGTVEFKYNNWLMLNGSADAKDLYVANISGQTLAAATDLTAKGMDQNDTLVINVSGKNVNFDSLNYGARENFGALNLSASHILYNFFEAENITFSGGFKGNILAPNANFNFLTGDLSGQVIAKSWTGNWGAQANLWDGFFVPHIDVPPVTPPSKVPEPSSILLMLVGALTLCWSRAKRT